jgi:hypothetical protein
MSPAPEPPRDGSRLKNYANIVATVALLVSLGSAAFTYLQVRTAKQQLQLAELQIRPYARERPRFEENGSDGLSISLINENLSAIPARIIYKQAKW